MNKEDLIRKFQARFGAIYEDEEISKEDLHSTIIDAITKLRLNDKKER